ncbi:MAG: transcription-repair coupling factor, partial [Microlunatus sp.]|nr:transcription-repair coupling factor [Microlunatus sp.]
FRGHDAEPAADVRIELPITAHLPEDYVESERLRLEMYKRLAEVRAEEDIGAIREELTDRYGPLPAEVDTLLEVAGFRLVARAAGLTEIVSQGNFIRFAPAELPESRQLRLKRLYPGAVVKGTAKLVLIPRPRSATIGGEPPRDSELLAWCTAAITAVFGG